MNSTIYKKTNNDNSPEGESNHEGEISQTALDETCPSAVDPVQLASTVGDDTAVEVSTKTEAGGNVLSLFNDCVANISIEFEQTWTSERTCSIEDELQKVDGSLRKQLFERLLEIDVSMRFEH